MTTTINGSSPSITFSDGSAQSSATRPFQNRIINGDFKISQYNGTSSVTPSGNAYVIDRYRYIGTQASKFTFQQLTTTPPTGFTYYLGTTVASAVTVGASDYFFLCQRIEGLNSYDLGWGTANAKTVTLSFQVYSSLTGTFGGVIQNGPNNYSYPFTYSIPTANTWTTISITVAGPTAGTWVTNNDSNIQVNFGLGAGATFSGTAGSWSANQYYNATGAVSVVGTAGATFNLTAIQLEVGSTATSFDYRPYGTELQLCQRYFQKIGGSVSGYQYSSMVVGWNDASNTFIGQVYLPVTMRSAPTLGTTGTASDYQYRGASPTTASLASVPTSGDMTTFGGRVDASFSGGTLTGGYGGSIRTQTNAGFLSFSAEL
jgi:hypothetical protein